MRLKLFVVAMLLSANAHAQEFPIDERFGAAMVCGSSAARNCAGAKGVAAQWIANWSGIVMGAASACGVPNERLFRVFDVVFAQAQQQARGEISRDALLQGHLKSFEQAAQLQVSGRSDSCFTSVRAFDALEHRCMKRKLARCVYMPPPPSTELPSLR